MTVVRCVVADDHPALLAAVEEHLRSAGIEVVSTAHDGARATAVCSREQPDVAVVDLRMPGCGGADLVARLRLVAPAMRIVVYTAEADSAVAGDVLAAGANGLVLKEAPLADLVRAVREVLAGGRYVDAGVVGGETRSKTQLTGRELEVLALLAEGLTHEQIGNRLDIGAETVRTHARKAAGRLGARSRTHAVAQAIRLGLL